MSKMSLPKAWPAVVSVEGAVVSENGQRWTNERLTRYLFCGALGDFLAFTYYFLVLCTDTKTKMI